MLCWCVLSPFWHVPRWVCMCCLLSDCPVNEQNGIQQAVERLTVIIFHMLHILRSTAYCRLPAVLSYILVLACAHHLVIAWNIMCETCNSLSWCAKYLYNTLCNFNKAKAVIQFVLHVNSLYKCILHTQSTKVDHPERYWVYKRMWCIQQGPDL